MFLGTISTEEYTGKKYKKAGKYNSGEDCDIS